MLLYHATYQYYLDSILENGLLASPENRNWSWGNEYNDNSRGFGAAVFLANDYDLAESFAETADYVPDDIFDSGIVVLEIDSDDLDADFLTYDPFYHNDIENELEDPYFEYSSVLDQAICFAYRGDIAPDIIRLCD